MLVMELSMNLKLFSNGQDKENLSILPLEHSLKLESNSEPLKMKDIINLSPLTKLLPLL